MVEVPRRRFTVEEFHRMAEAGLLTEDDRVELIEGELWEMTPIGRRHAGTVDFLADLFARGLGERALVRVQNPIRLGEYSEPQPDLLLLRRRADFYRGGHPGPQDAFLVVEVAESRVEVDRRVKIPLYGRHGVPEAWLVDLEGGRVEVYREPSPEGYRLMRLYTRGERLSPQAFPDLEVPLDDLLGEE